MIVTVIVIDTEPQPGCMLGICRRGHDHVIWSTFLADTGGKFRNWLWFRFLLEHCSVIKDYGCYFLFLCWLDYELLVYIYYSY